VALRLYDEMNFAMSQVAKSFAPAPSLQTDRPKPSPAASHAEDLRQFVQDFAQRFFGGVGPDQLQDKTPIQAYSDLSKRASEIADQMRKDIEEGRSTYDYFERKGIARYPRLR
jgi:hypothetical protein